MWAEEDQESEDISTLISTVVSRPGWRAGSHIMLQIMQRRRDDLQQDPCQISSADAGFPPRLRVTFDAPDTTKTPVGPCDVSVSGTAGGACSSSKSISARARASSENLSPKRTAKAAYSKADAPTNDKGGLDWCVVCFSPHAKGIRDIGPTRQNAALV